MLVRLAWAWTFLIASWASIVASKSPSVFYEMMSAYGIYNIAWQYKGADQRYIYPLLDAERDKKLVEESYRQQGHRGSLPNGKMNWEEFAAAWFRDDSIDPSRIPPLDLDNIEATAKALKAVKEPRMVPIALASGQLPVKVGGNVQEKKYHELLTEWMNMVVEARERLPVAPMRNDLKAITLANEKAKFIRLTEFRQTQYLGADLKRVFPGIRILGFDVAIPEFEKNYKMVDVAKTLSDPVNKRNMPDILAKAIGWHQLPFDPVDWKERFQLLVVEYGRETYQHSETKKLMSKKEREAQRSALSHRKVLEAVKALKEKAQDTPACQAE
ncbi:hypothetical protein B0H65DRAFT_459307 [Neurospora tetraspora]|uniref:Uncharacterized protein n=1 Tax=Neurospora tetraspora TaxID=94610 RepID=A0AAE0JM07_9PEZI|nr:hypothetical protein B0H65DRAFT_459307 [Neurospora tetraspora]